MILSEAIEALAVATIADGRTEGTAGEYRAKLSQLVTFLGDCDVNTITVHDLRRFVAHLRQRSTRYQRAIERPEVAGGLSPATVAGHVRSFKRLFRWLQDEGVISDNPARRIKVPSVPRDEPKGYEHDDLARLLAATAGDDAESIRNRAIVLFLADTGCRVGGLVGLKLSDLDLYARIAKVTEKGNKTRIVSFMPSTAAAIQTWLDKRPAGDHEHVWSTLGTRGGRWLTEAGVRQVLRRLKKRAGVTGPANPHAFRHGYAREYILNGGEIGTLAEQLGHSSVNTTWRSYAIFHSRELQGLHDKFSPIAQMEKDGTLRIAFF